jgi:hypothetical protein
VTTSGLAASARCRGVGADPVTIHITDQTISFTANGSPYTVNVPDTALTLSKSATSATATFNAGANEWDISAPASFSGNVMLGGAELAVPGGLPGGIKNVVWNGQFSSDTAGLR